MSILDVSEYKNQLIKSLDLIESKVVRKIVDEIFEARQNNRTIFIIGNGGSAATASHMATDFTFGSRMKDPYIKAISLVDNSAIITATGNDVDFESIFSRRLNAIGSEGDILIMVSASGNSPNLLACIDTCKAKGIKTISLTGFNGGQLKDLVDISLHIPTEMGAYGIAEDSHMIVGHIITELLKSKSEMRSGN